ncbi:MAG TPA: xanthine dehydrogenase family protein molybdopterin-binding subunit [Casimicrobiaceae bacterium]|nr:xanthine dehydrogenase family protein molybdopterin-binding subunit [Casimicrobiaceae bacterium]
MSTPRPRTVGHRVRRIEDPALLQGKGRFVDDIKLPGALHVAFVRSPHAHALIRSIDFSDALALPGVIAVYGARDLAGTLAQQRLPLAFPEGKLSAEAMPFILACDEACYVGEAIAMVVATSRYIADDAIDRVVVDYDVQPALVDPREAIADGAPPACSTIASNLFTRFTVGYGECDQSFASAAHVLSDTLFQHRGVAHPMEGRGILAHVDPGTETLTLWSSTQLAHELRDNVAEMLNRPVDKVRVIVPDVGGGFGAKFMVYPEEIAVAAAAVLLGRPVKWIEDRREHFVSAIQERDQYWQIEIAVDADGVLRGVRGQLVHDQGAYAPHAITVPYNSASSLPGPYVLPAYALDVLIVRTNKPPVIPVRGAGYPQGTFAMERMLDLVADKLGIDRAEVRRRNLIPASRMPYPVGLINRAGNPVVYDSGDYPTCQSKGLEAADYAGFRARQEAARRAGRWIGIGMSHGLKCTGRGPYETATVRVAPTGRVLLYTGAHAMGQGIETALAQICCDQLGVSIDDIDVTCGDTAFVSSGIGGYASRQAIIAGSSVQLAAQAVREKALKVAGQLLGADKDLVLANGAVHVAGRPDLAVSLGRIAVALRGAAGYWFPEGVEVGLEATRHFRVDAMTYANGFHVCEVEIDIGTGHVHVTRYIAVQDSGKIVNPLLAEGQIVGGIVHGIGNALFERMAYDSSGQPITTTFADYLLPTSTEVPHIEVLTNETLSPLNPMGMKGVGEVSVLPVTAAIASAIDDALRPLGVRVREVPLSPVRLLEMILDTTSADGSTMTDRVAAGAVRAPASTMT